MAAIVGHKRNIEHQRNRYNPSIRRFNRIAVFVRVAFDFRPNFAEFLVGINYAKLIKIYPARA